MGLKLFDRRAILTVNTIRIELLRFQFTIKKDIKPTPNKAEIKVYNLTRSHQEALATQAPTGVPVQLEAGYKDGTSQIFLGSLRFVHTMRDGADLVTTVESGDGLKQFQQARTSSSFAKGVSNQTVLRQVASDLGVSTGNLNDAIGKLSAASVFANGTSCYGSASEEMTRICKSLDLEWSIQGEKLQVLPRNKAVEGKAIRLTGDTGMIGEPSIDPKGVLSVECLMQPDVYPGRLLVLDGERLKGQFRIQQTVHTGDSRATTPWKISIQAKRY